MTKSFNDHERSIIKQKLIESCEACWSKYGYKKTSVGELCKMAGISTGAFYLFFPSKGILFMETAQAAGNRIMSIIDEIMPENPTKYDFARGTKLIFRELEKADWLLSLSGDIELFLRKLPPDFLEQDYKNDYKHVSFLVEKYGLTPKKDMDVVVSTFQILFLSILNKKNLVGKSDEALDFMVDAIVENLFE